MPIADLLQQVVNFFPVVIIIVVIIALISPFISSTSLNIESSFNDICKDGDVGILYDLNYDSQTSLAQFMLSQSFLSTEDIDMKLVYPRNTFDIISSLFDNTNCNMEDKINLYSNQYFERKNSNFLEQCVNNACLCVVKTRADYMAYDHLQLTACFPRLYSYKPAHDYFNNNFPATCVSDLASFTTAIQTTLDYLNADDNSAESQAIIDCYYLFSDLGYSEDKTSKYTYTYSGSPGKYLLLINNKNGDLLSQGAEVMEDALNDYYSLTKAGLFTEVSTCYSIPVEDKCYCPYISNFMTSGNQGLFLGIAGSKYLIGEKSLDVDSFIMQLDNTGSSCQMNVQIT